MPLAKTFQHSLVARIWHRIVTTQTPAEEHDPRFLDLLNIVDKLNTLRNIYMLFTAGLVRSLTARARIAPLALSFEDAAQIGTFGVARAAYRYHPSCGVRFSTFAARWIYREIQQQALHGRLIRISSNNLEAHAQAIRDGDAERLQKYQAILATADIVSSEPQSEGGERVANPSAPGHTPESLCEQRQLGHLLLDCIDRLLDAKKGDVIKRRFGLSPYQDGAESVITISQALGVTRSSVYQLEQSALRVLRNHLCAQP